MAAMSEKILWPIVGIFIFGVLAGFYIDDRRSLMQEKGSTETTDKQADSSEHGGKTAEHKQTSNEHAGKTAEKMPSRTNHTASSNHTGATSMDINEYLAQSSNERSQELEANVAHHQGFHGNIDEYLSGSKPKSNNMQAKSESQQATGATSMSMEEYRAKASGGSPANDSASQSGAYHGDMDGYLAKYADGSQTQINNASEKPFNKKEHMGFHGSYEEYAKKYN